MKRKVLKIDPNKIRKYSESNYLSPGSSDKSPLISFTKEDCANYLEISPNDFNRQTLSPKGLEDTKRLQSFMEMMGMSKKKETKTDRKSELNLQIDTPTISLIDFMGSQRYSFLKNSGFLPIYCKFQRNGDAKKLASDKNVLSLPNIQHLDLIRENCIKNKPSPRSSSNIPYYKKIDLYDSNKKLTKVDKVHLILSKCDEFFEKSSKPVKIEQIITEKVKEPVLRKSKLRRKFTNKELNYIKSEVNKII